jgi:dipeptidyl aminopeptidase/acylaminoacyl peptidase
MGRRNGVSLVVSTLTQFVGFAFVASSLAQGQPGTFGGKGTGSKRPITVKDAIEMTRLAGEDYLLGVSAKGNVAKFSPDGKRFVVALRKADLQRNTNDCSLYLFYSSEVFHGAMPLPLLTMSSSSNHEAISDVKWLADNETIVFRGENPGEVSELYALNVESKRLEKLTTAPTAIQKYDVTPEGSELLYLAAPPDPIPSNTEEVSLEGVVVSNQSLSELLAGKRVSAPSRELFVQRRGSLAVRIPLSNPTDGRILSVSPDGKTAIVDAPVLAEDLPASWSRYIFAEDDYLHGFFHHAKGWSPFKRYLLVDIESRSVKTLETGPTLMALPVNWASDDTAIIRGVYLPVDPEDDTSRRDTHNVAVNVLTGEFHRTTDGVAPKPSAPGVKFEVTLDEDINTPPKIFAIDPEEKRRTLLLDLNPQFAGLSFGSVEEITWKVNGVEVVGGLYLPPNYKATDRYPLVIQTHGFTSERFSMDGLDEWSSGYAARALTAQGFLVLQAYDFKDRKTHNLVGRDRALGAAPEESFKRFSSLAYGAAIDYLDRRGMVDRARVGISGFSRTVCTVGYTVTHTRLRFAAVALTDGIDCGYFNYMSYPHEAPDANALNGGLPPFGEQGLRMWLKEAPAFNLNENHAPVRLVALGFPSVLQSWEWFTALRLQGKPVELVVVPEASHLLQKAADRRIVMQGLVDWFMFWLKNEENPDSPNREQFVRWRALRSECRDEACQAGAADQNRNE